jgi:transcriptional regulator with AAA-type ATPase domain
VSERVIGTEPPPRESLLDAAGPTGETAAMRNIREELRRLAPLDTTVLITGETGVGKGVCARTLHRLSGRGGELVHVDCAALAPTLLESELFGHERGAFTGAAGRRIGRLERAAGGTLFLDEIAELDRTQQARLLGALQERRFERVGGSGAIRLGARIVAATSRDLEGDVRRERFRADLYYRIAVARIPIPPLRERRRDVPLLVAEGLRAISQRLRLPPPALGEQAVILLASRPWRGNVRELFNALERLTIRCSGRRVGAAELLRALADDLDPFARDASTCGAPARIRAALHATRGNVAAAARSLGLPRTTLRRRIAALAGDDRAGSARGQLDRLEDHEPQRDHGEHAPVEPREPQLGDAAEDPAAHPRSRDHRGGEQQQRDEVAGEGEAGDPEHDELRQVPECLTGRLRADDSLAREAEVQEEGRDQRTGGPDGGIQDAHDSPEDDEAPLPVTALRVQAHGQDARHPGRQQHEDPDQGARHGGLERGRDRQADEAHRQQQQRVAQYQPALDVPTLDPGTRSVRDELHRAVQRDRGERSHEQQHHGEQDDAAGHADDRGQDGGRERREDEDGERERLHRRRARR